MQHRRLGRPRLRRRRVRRAQASVGISERQIAPLDGAGQPHRDVGPRAIDDGRRRIEHLQHPAPRRRAALDQVGDPAERNHRPAQHGQVGVEGDELANREPPVDDLAAAQPQHDQGADPEQEGQARVEEALQADQAAVAAQELGVGALEAGQLGLLLAVGADDPDSGQRLLRHRRQLGQLGLDPLEAAMDGRAEAVDRDRDERQRHQGHAGQPRIDRQHQEDRDDEDDAGRDRVHHRRAGHHADGRQVVGRARHQVAGAPGLEVGQRQPLQVAEEVVADVELDVPRGNDELLPHLEAEPAADAGDGQQRRGVAAQRRQRGAIREVVDRQPEHPRADELDGGRDQRGEESQRDGALIAADVGKQPPQRRPGHVVSICAAPAAADLSAGPPASDTSSRASRARTP